MIPIAYNNSVWLVEPNHLQRIAAHVSTYERCYTAREVAEANREAMAHAKDISVHAFSGSGVTHALEAKIATPQQIRAVKGKVGVIPVHGPVDQRMSSALLKAGGTSTDFIGAALDTLLNDPSVGAIVLHVDSPGGGVYGVQELADKIYAARSRKPIYAIADSLSASAGYWIASSAGTMLATPGADIGSVGVYLMHIDESAAMEKEGIKVSVASAGKYKVEFSPFSPLGDDAKAHMQSTVDAIYDRFVLALKRSRGASVEEVRTNYGQGRVMSADRALAAGMIDRIMTYQELIERLTGGTGAATGVRQDMPAIPRASAEVLRLRHQHRVKKKLADQP